MWHATCQLNLASPPVDRSDVEMWGAGAEPLRDGWGKIWVSCQSRWNAGVACYAVCPPCRHTSPSSGISSATDSVNLSLFLQFKLLLIAYLEVSSQGRSRRKIVDIIDSTVVYWGDVTLFTATYHFISQDTSYYLTLERSSQSFEPFPHLNVM